MEEKTEFGVKQKIKKVGDIKFWQFSYAFLASVATAVGGSYAVYKHFNPEPVQKQEIVIKYEREKAEEINPKSPESSKAVQYSNVEVVNEPKPSAMLNKTAIKTAEAKIQENASNSSAITEKAKIDSEDNGFGIVKNKNKGSSQNTSVSKVVQVYAKAIVLGDSKSIDGETIKIRMYEDLDCENYLMTNTTLFGNIEIKGNRIFVELKDKQGNLFYLYDKSEHLGLPLAEKIPDSYQVKISNIKK